MVIFFNIFLVTIDMTHHVYNFELTKTYFDKIILFKNSPVQPLPQPLFPLQSQPLFG